MLCVKCGKEIFVDEKCKTSNLGLEFRNYVLEDVPKHLQICISCSEDLYSDLMLGKFSGIMSLGKLFKKG